ncbi:MAG TPA: AMP-binding protein [Thermohalobaculum sp.]|nr:AMP-binding protein [Thermohalobaculum sp.]
MIGKHGFSSSADRFCITSTTTKSRSDFLADVAAARIALAAHDAICNMALRRYDFMVLLAAALLNGQTTVLPSSRARRAIAAAVEGWASVLFAESLGDVAMPDAAAVVADDIDALADQLPFAPGEVHVFTSGSTGEPVRHVKTWDILAGGARLAAEVIGRAGLRPDQCVIVGTTPHQHMFGLEAAVFTGLAHGFCLYDAPVFYPADLESLVARVEALDINELVLITSPPHLKFLQEALRQTPQVRCIISATAPLHRDVAARLEADGARRVFEIYGSTETGSLAWRRTATNELWTPLEGFRLTPGEDGWFADAQHLAHGAILGDDIELSVGSRFRLLGRHGDMVRIAGKRQSLGALNAALTAMPDIRDGVVIRETVGDEDRLSVFVVPDPASTMDTGALRQAVRMHMRSHFDLVFVPRRVQIIDQIPRGETGKIAAGDLAALAASGSKLAAKPATRRTSRRN